MNEQEPKEMPEVRNAEIKKLVMEEMGWTEEEWLEEYALAVSNFGFEISQGEIVLPEETLVPPEIEEAAYNYLYQQYIAAETDEDPLEIFPKKPALPVNFKLRDLEEKGRELSDEALLLSTSERRKIAIEKNRKELLKRQEAGDLDRVGFELNYLFYLTEQNQPLTRKDLETISRKQALVITQKDLETLGPFDIVLPDGEVMTIDPEDTGYGPEDQLIIFPEDLGGIIGG